MVLVANVKMLGTAQSMVECDVDFEGVNVAKILSVQAMPRIANTEVLDGEIIFDGIAVLKAFVLCQDGGIKTFTSQHKFSGKLDNKDIVILAKIVPQAKCIDTVISSVSEKGAKITCSIESSMIGYVNSEVPINSENQEDLEMKEKEIQTWAVNYNSNTEFETAGEILISGEDVRVVLAENSCVIKNTSVGNGFGVVKGEIATRILFTNGANNSALQSASTITSFTQEIEIPNSTKDGMMQASVTLSEEKFKLLLSQEEKQAKVTLEFSLQLSVSEFELQTSTVIEDAYSISNETDLIQTTFNQSIPLGELFFEKKIEGNVVLDDSQPRINKMLASSAITTGAIQTSISEGRVSLVGVAYANIIFEGETEEEVTEETQIVAPNSVQIEIPFEISEACQNDANLIYVTASIDEIDISVKKGRNVFFDAKIKAHIFMNKQETNSCITSIALSAPRKEKDGGLEIVFAKKGNTIWDYAKKLGVQSSLILAQNPQITDPLDKDDKIVIFHRNEIAFE